MSGGGDGGGRVRWVDLVIEDEPNREPRYAIAAVAARSGVRVQTVRSYQQNGLIEPARVEAGLLLYSEADIERVRRIRRLVDDLGVNLDGAAAILHLREQLLALQRELLALRHRDVPPSRPRPS